MIEVDDAGTLPQQLFQHRLSFDERQRPQVFAVEIQQVKSDEDALATAEQQITEHGPARLIPTGNLTIQDGTFNAKSSRRHFSKAFGRATKVVTCTDFSPDAV